MATAFFSDLLSTISERGRTLLRRGASSDRREDASELLELCEALLSGRGEATGTAMAREVLDRYHDLDAAGRASFFALSPATTGPTANGFRGRSRAGARNRATPMPAICILHPSRGARN